VSQHRPELAVTPAAARILRALSRGLDPDTGEVLAADSVLRRAEIIRALQEAARVLENPARRRADRTWHAPLPPKTGTPWSEERTRPSAAAAKTAEVVEQLAADLGRTPNAVATRLARLGPGGDAERPDR